MRHPVGDAVRSSSRALLSYRCPCRAPYTPVANPRRLSHHQIFARAQPQARFSRLRSARLLSESFVSSPLLAYYRTEVPLRIKLWTDDAGMAEWYTHTTQNRAGQPMRVRVSLPAQHNLN